MALWFRFYSDAMRHPKVSRLSDIQFRLWVELLCVAAENDGFIPRLTDLKHILKRRLDHLSRGVEDLLKASLIEPLGDGYTPCNWGKRQYKSDTSTDRVKKHREKRNVSVTPPEPEPKPDTEPEGKTKAKKASSDVVFYDVDSVVEAWNEMASQNGLSKVKAMTPQRCKACQARINDYTIKTVIEAIQRIPSSSFLLGKAGGWSANIDFLLRPDSILKIIEGKYDDKKPVTNELAANNHGLRIVLEREANRAAERDRGSTVLKLAHNRPEMVH